MPKRPTFSNPARSRVALLPGPGSRDVRSHSIGSRTAAALVACLLLGACSATGTLPEASPKRAAAGPANDNPPIELSSAPEVLEIRELEALRSPGNGKLVSYLLSSEEPSIRARAAVALGRLPFPEFGSSITGPLCTALEDESAEVRLEAATALGMRADPESAGVLLAYWRDPEPRVRERIIRAASRVATPPIRTQVMRSMQDPDPGVRQAAIRSTYDWSRDDSDAETIDRELVSTLAPTRAEPGKNRALDPDVVWSALFALQRRKAEAGRGAFLQYSTSDDPRARIFAVRGLASITPSSEGTKALTRAMADEDWRVVCEAALGLGESGDASAVPLLLAAVDHTSVHVRTRALEALRKFPEQAIAILPVAWRGQSDLSGMVRSAAMWTLGELLTQTETVELLQKASADRNPVVRAGAATAAAETLESFRAIPLLETLSRELSPLVATAAIEGLKKHINPQSRAILHGFLSSPDNGRRLSAILALAHEDNASPKDAAPIAEAIATAKGDIAPEVAYNGLRCLGKIGGDEARRAVVRALDYPNFFVRRVAQEVLTRDFGQPRALAGTGAQRPIIAASKAEVIGRELPLRTRNPMVDIRTSRGTMTFELLAAEVPRHVEQFIRLAREGHYDGLTFHRVVPNFVIQGGDYRGDGNGGVSPEGESIGQEFTMRTYERGSLGTPRNDDPDSGGGQLFVTHSNTPHLDGRYTLFGRMTAGGKVLDSIELGDVIEGVLVTE